MGWQPQIKLHFLCFSKANANDLHNADDSHSNTQIDELTAVIEESPRWRCFCYCGANEEDSDSVTILFIPSSYADLCKISYTEEAPTSHRRHAPPIPEVTVIPEEEHSGVMTGDADTSGNADKPGSGENSYRVLILLHLFVAGLRMRLLIHWSKCNALLSG